MDGRSEKNDIYQDLTPATIDSVQEGEKVTWSRGQYTLPVVR